METGGKESAQLYNIRIIRTYIEYLEKYYPDVCIEEVLEYAGITRYELDDLGVWYTQETADRFQEIFIRLTKNENISRDAGRYVVSSTSYKFIRQFIYGSINPRIAYALLPTIHAKVSKGAHITVHPAGPNTLTVISTPLPGVKERRFQCQNRIGQLEALAAAFTGRQATVEHTHCFHDGAGHCEYQISWIEPHFLKLKRWRNRVLLGGLSLCGLLSFFLPHHYNIMLLASILALSCGLTLGWWYLAMLEFKKQVEDQAHTADLLILEASIRSNEANLVQEIGQAVSKFLDIEDMLDKVMDKLKQRLDFDRGMVFLANADKTRLVFKSGYGFTDEQEEFFRRNEFHLDKPESKGPFIRTFKDQKPLLIEKVDTITDTLSVRSQELLNLAGSSSFVCVPIVYENEPLGILSVDRFESVSPLRQSDLNLLMGIAPQIAISINNARTFEKMEESEEKYRDLVEGANSIIVRLDNQGRITFANRYAREFYGYTEEILMGKPIFGFIVPEISSAGLDYKDGYQLFLRNPEHRITRETETVRKDGTRAWVSWSNKAKRNKEGEVTEILCVGYDITARVLAEEEKKSLESQLVRSQKMEAIGALAGGVAHDLNNILSGITSYPELLLLELPTDSPLRKAVTTIKKSGEKAAAIVQDLLTMARRGVNVSNVVDLNSIVREYFESPEFRKIQEYHPHVVFKRQYDEKLKCILGSNVHLGKTLMNLVSNAAEAISNGGLVKVSTGNRYLEKPLKGYDRVDVGEYAVLSVSDTGTGISHKDLKKIFEPFFSKKVMGRSGTGLGMTVVWSTVKDHNGYIDVESVEGKGTRFDLYFPVTGSLAKEKEKESIEKYLGTEKILVVDDSEDQREIAKSFLQKLGYRVEARESGEEALAYLGQNQADLVLLDMIMNPEMDGLDTFIRIREINTGQKAIIVSGFSETDRVKKALDLGVGSYIRKPYALADLARLIREELDKPSVK